MSVEEFDQFVLLPGHVARQYEFIGGEVVEVVSNQVASYVALRVGYFITAYLMQHPIGYATGADGGYVVAGERYIPDVGFITRQRQPALSDRPYNPLAPDLAVEVLSPTNDPHDMRIKVGNYLTAGTVVWVIRPDTRTVEVYTPGAPVRRLGIDGTLDGGAVLPGFSLAVADIFPGDAADG